MGRHAAGIIAAESRADRPAGPRPTFRYVDKGMMATIGRARAVGRIMGMRTTGLIAWLLWALVHVAFLIGFLSPSKGDEAYIHFVGVDPAFRRHGIGAALYERFFELARQGGRSRVKAITGSINTASIAFHGELGFRVSAPIDGYDRPGAEHVVFTREI